MIIVETILFFILMFLSIGFGAGIFFILKEYENGVVFRLGRYSSTKTPGFNFRVPVIDKVVTVDLRINTLDVPTQEVITKDNIPVQVNAVCYFFVSHPDRVLIKVENYRYAISQVSQTALRSICGELELDSILSEREVISQKLQEIISDTSEAWGVSIVTVELKDVHIPESMQRAFASQAEAERERRAKVIAAEGEFQASQKLAEAAQIIDATPQTLQLRYLQTIKDTSQQQNSHTTIIAPLPLDIFENK